MYNEEDNITGVTSDILSALQQVHKCGDKGNGAASYRANWICELNSKHNYFVDPLYKFWERVMKKIKQQSLNSKAFGEKNIA